MVLAKSGILTGLLCLGVLALLVFAVDPAAVATALRGVPPASVLAALLVVEVQIVLSAIRWRFTAARLGHPLPLALAISEYAVGGFLNQILPGGMAGDAIRAYRARTGEPGGWKRPAAAVVLERLSGQVAFFLLAGAGLLAWPALIAARIPVGPAALALIVIAPVAAAVGLAFALFRSSRFHSLQRLKPDLAATFLRDGAFAVQAGLSVAIVATYVLTFFIASDAVGAKLPAVAALTVIPLCLLTMLIPVGVGGWGTREAAAVALWPLLGLSSADGLAASLLYGALCLAGTALPALAALALGLVRRRIDRA